MKNRKMRLGLVAAVCVTAAGCVPQTPDQRAAVNHEMGCLAGGIAGAVIGSAIGNEFGSGAGNDIMRTAFGAVEGRRLSCG